MARESMLVNLLIYLNYHCIAEHGMQLAYLRSDVQIGVDV